MARFIPSTFLAVSLMLNLGAAPAPAENEGQADLDKAIQLKVVAASVKDLSEVIGLCESALKQGLDKGNAQMATDLLASALIQRGTATTAKTFRNVLQNGNWQQDRKDALADLEKAIQLSPKQPQALFMIARLSLLPEGDAQRATTALDETIELSGDEPMMRAEALMLRSNVQKDPLKKLADLDDAVSTAPANAAVLRARGAARADSGKLEAAMDDFNKAIELEPADPSGHLLKAMVLVKQNKYDEAQVVLESAQRAAPNAIDLPVTAARIFGLQANYKAALEQLERAMAKEPNNVAVLLLRAGVYQEMGEKQKALADVDKILQLKPGLVAAIRDRAVLLADLGKLDEAAAELEKLRQAEPKDSLTLLQLGMLYSVQKKYDKAVDAFSAVVAEHPDEWMALRSRADCLLNLGRRGDAIADYDKALRQQPKNPTILNNLAWVLATAPEENLRDGKRALVLANEAAKATNFKEDFILSTLAAAYAETGDYESAVKWSTKAVENGTKEHADALKKELESYQAGKPWREVLPAAEEEKKPETPVEEKKPEKKKAKKKQPKPKAKTVTL